MNSLFSAALLFFCLGSEVALTAQTPHWEEHPEWIADFKKTGATGSMLVYDEPHDTWLVFDRARAETGFIPASTFKIFNALTALETGAVKDEYEVIRWDGKDRDITDWNRDQNLASAMHFSVVWFYQEMARRVGEKRMQDWINRVGYGNRNISGGIDHFWLDGELRISAVEQISFLRRLADGTLPFSSTSQEIVRRITIVEEAPGYTIHAKTGAAMRTTMPVGWYVGWVERAGKRWFFAANIDMPQSQDMPKRTALARAVLTRVGALP